MAPAVLKSLGAHGVTGEEAQASFIAKSEGDIHKQIKNLLNLRGIWFCHSRMDKPTTQRKGVPDFMFALSGIATAFEVKYGKGKRCDEQIAVHEAMTRNGWQVYTVRSLDEARDILNS
jgi:hypothetical protein